MELQINQFWIFESSKYFNSANEYEPDVNMGLKTPNFTKISAFATQKFGSFWRYLLNITPKKLKLPPSVKFH